MLRKHIVCYNYSCGIRFTFHTNLTLSIMVPRPHLFIIIWFYWWTIHTGCRSMRVGYNISYHHTILRKRILIRNSQYVPGLLQHYIVQHPLLQPLPFLQFIPRDLIHQHAQQMRDSWPLARSLSSRWRHVFSINSPVSSYEMVPCGSRANRYSLRTGRGLKL